MKPDAASGTPSWGARRFLETVLLSRSLPQVSGLVRVSTAPEGTSELISSVQSLSRVRLFSTPWTAAHRASLSIINSRSSLKLMSIESVMPSNYLILCRPLLLSPSIFPASGSFPVSQFFASNGQSTGVSTSVSVLQMSIQDLFPLGWSTGWISLQSKALSRVFSNTIVQTINSS